MIFVYLIALLAGIFWGITESINKNVTEKKYSVFSYTLIQWCGNALIYLVPFLLFGHFPRNNIAYLFLAAIIICFNVGNILLIKAYKTEDLSNINIISKSSLVISFLAGILLLKEPFNIYKLLGILGILGGIFILFYEGKRFQTSVGLFFAVTSGTIFGFAMYFNKRMLEYFDVVSAIFLFNLLSAFLLLIIPNTLKDVKPILLKYKWKILLSRLTMSIAGFLIVWSIKNGAISIVNANYETAFLLSTAFIGILFLHERKNIAKKLAGSFLCALGIILLNFF